MDINLNTPSLLFPAISLLMLAYTNRFLGLASVIRELHDDYQKHPEPRFLQQIANMRKRIRLIRDMQTCGVLSLLLCMICMFLLFGGLILAGKVVFALSLILMIASLAISLREIQMSVIALDIHLQNLERIKDA